MAMLRTNARETLTKMSRKIHMPISTIYDKIKHQETRLIKRHTCLLDFASLGFMTRATILLCVRKDAKDKLIPFLTKHQNINSVFKINNGYDYLIETVFRQIKDLEDFMELLQERFAIKKYQVHYIIDEMQREGFLANPDTIDLLYAEP